jgi:acetate kinase
MAEPSDVILVLNAGSSSLKLAVFAGAYALYAAAAAVSLPFVWACVRETRGKTLEQM